MAKAAAKAAATTASTFSHPGTAVTSGTTTKNAKGAFLLRTGDVFNCGTHGPGKVIIGSALRARDLDGKTFARVEDLASCGAIIMSGDTSIMLS